MVRRVAGLLTISVAMTLAAVAIVGAAEQQPTSPQRRARGRPGRARNRPNRNPLKVGQMAPDFELVLVGASLAKTTTQPASRPASRPTTAPAVVPVKVKLSSFRGKLPVVLIFSSYT